MIFTERFYVGYSDVDRNYALSNTAILKMFEDVTSMHSLTVGDDYKNSVTKWFLTAYHVKVFKRPSYCDFVNVSTWSNVSRGFTSCRQFEIRTMDGELCIVARSNWARINTLSGVIEKITPDVIEMYQSEPDKTNFDSPWIGKITECEKYDICRDFCIDRNFIDANGHMNNVYYLDLATLTLPEEVYEKQSIDEFEIIYRKSVGYGERVSCLYADCEDHCNVAVKSADGQLRAIMKLYSRRTNPY